MSYVKSRCKILRASRITPWQSFSGDGEIKVKIQATEEDADIPNFVFYNVSWGDGTISPGKNLGNKTYPGKTDVATRTMSHTYTEVDIMWITLKAVNPVSQASIDKAVSNLPRMTPLICLPRCVQSIVKVSKPLTAVARNNMIGWVCTASNKNLMTPCCWRVQQYEI